MSYSISQVTRDIVANGMVNGTGVSGPAFFLWLFLPIALAVAIAIVLAIVLTPRN